MLCMVDHGTVKISWETTQIYVSIQYALWVKILQIPKQRFFYYTKSFATACYDFFQFHQEKNSSYNLSLSVRSSECIFVQNQNPSNYEIT